MTLQTICHPASVTTRTRRAITAEVVLGTFILLAQTGPGLGQSAGVSLQVPCPEPLVGLHQGATNTSVEQVPFTVAGQTFQMEIASAFAPRHANGSASFCLRYEAENNTPRSTPPGQEQIDRFYWPMAEMAVERFQAGPQFRQSILQTAPSAQPPVLTSTELFAFKRTRFSSSAYKLSTVRHTGPNIIPVSFGDNKVVPPNTRSRIEEPKLTQQQTGLSFEGAPHPIGAAWQTPITQVVATTELDPSRTINSISVTIARQDNKYVGRIIAPFAQALAVAKEPSQIPGLIGEYRQKPIEMINDVAHFGNSAAVDPHSSETRLFVVKQPIIFFGADGSRVCFLAPTYSPVQVPSRLMTCDPDEVFLPR
jgi:hypothetical protein